MGMLGTVLERRPILSVLKGKVPKLYAVVRFIAYGKAFMQKKSGVGKKGLLFRRRKNAEALFPFLRAVFYATVQKASFRP